MVLAGIVLDEKDIPTLKELGVKDSKLLSPQQREQIYSKITKTIKTYKIVKIFPEEIDNTLNSPTTNLNWLEGDKMIEIINALKADKAIVDCPSPNIQAFTHYLEGKLTSKTKIQCEHKADLNFLIVGAASILAKVTRDREVEIIKRRIGKEFGSGYPSDPLTKKFLEEHWNTYPEIFRHSWSSYKKYSEGVKSKKQKSLSEF
jgi:ribonuclease HII